MDDISTAKRGDIWRQAPDCEDTDSTLSVYLSGIFGEDEGDHQVAKAHHRGI